MQHIVNVPTWVENTPRGAQRQLPMLGAINEALVELAKRDENFFVYGQDVGSPKGGVFGATAQLVRACAEHFLGKIGGGDARFRHPLGDG